MGATYIDSDGDPSRNGNKLTGIDLDLYNQDKVQAKKNLAEKAKIKVEPVNINQNKKRVEKKPDRPPTDNNLTKEIDSLKDRNKRFSNGLGGMLFGS